MTGSAWKLTQQGHHSLHSMPSGHESVLRRFESPAEVIRVHSVQHRITPTDDSQVVHDGRKTSQSGDSIVESELLEPKAI
jgi:hypothetical protein